MIEAILIMIILLVVLKVVQVVLAMFHFIETKRTNLLLSKDSTQSYMQAIQSQKTTVPTRPPSRNGIPMQGSSRSQQEDNTNLLEMDAEEGYEAIERTMGVQ
jgi:hypothetical protein